MLLPDRAAPGRPSIPPGAPSSRRGSTEAVTGRRRRARRRWIPAVALVAGLGLAIAWWVSDARSAGRNPAASVSPCSGPDGPEELCPLTQGAGSNRELPPPSPGQYFSSASSFNQVLPAGLVALPGSAWVAQALAAGPAADIYAYGIPIFTDVTPSTPSYHVSCTEDWGRCPLAVHPVPIPADAKPSPGSDSEMVVVDRGTGLAYEFWRARRTGSRWTASWGAVVTLGGSGAGDPSMGPGGTGSGISQLAGVVTIQEVEQGLIPHAIAFSSSLTCDSFVPPAVKSDGHGKPPHCLPEGARVRLSPSVDLASIPGITPLELVVGRALQTYGAILRDTGGSSLALAFQEPPAGGPDPYARFGATGDYYNFPHLPWHSLELVNG